MGLLQKANERSEHTPQIRLSKFPRIKEKLHSIRKTIKFHPTLFRELANLFSIEKGALLIREGKRFTLNSIIGYDETTSNRLRITESEYNNYEETKNLDTLKKYFSIREFKTVSELILIPFTGNSEIEGLLLITEFKTETKPTKQELLNYATELAILWQENPIVNLTELGKESNNSRDAIVSFVQRLKSEENRVIFLKINLNTLIEGPQLDKELTTKSSLKNNITKVLNSFVQKNGKVFQLHDSKLLLVFLDKRCTLNVTMLQQQINTVLASVFSVKPTSLDLNYESLTWKDNSLDTILDHLITDGTN